MSILLRRQLLGVDRAKAARAPGPSADRVRRNTQRAQIVDNAFDAELDIPAAVERDRMRRSTKRTWYRRRSSHCRPATAACSGTSRSRTNPLRRAHSHRRPRSIPSSRCTSEESSARRTLPSTSQQRRRSTTSMTPAGRRSRASPRRCAAARARAGRRATPGGVPDGGTEDVPAARHQMVVECSSRRRGVATAGSPVIRTVTTHGRTALRHHRQPPPAVGRRARRRHGRRARPQLHRPRRAHQRRPGEPSYPARRPGPGPADRRRLRTARAGQRPDDGSRAAAAAEGLRVHLVRLDRRPDGRRDADTGSPRRDGRVS